MKMKKILSLMMAAIMVLAMVTACSPKEAASTNENTAEAPAEETPAAEETTEEQAQAPADKVFKIGVCQLVEHAALDASYEGFVAGLKEAGFEDGVNIEIDYQNAQGDQATCNTIAAKFVNDGVDLILAIATPAAQAVANATKDIPILVTAVTDPAESKLVASNDAPGGNVSGTSDLTPVAKQIELLKQLIPDAENIAVLYCSSEGNSKIQGDMAVAKAEELGLKAEVVTVADSNEIQQVVQSLVGKVDAIYSPTDNVIAAGMQTVALVSEPNNIPVIVGESNMVHSGGLATYGIDYFELGRQTGAQAVKILAEGANPAEMPIEYLEEVELTINVEQAEKIGVTIPQELLDQLK